MTDGPLPNRTTPRAATVPSWPPDDCRPPTISCAPPRRSRPACPSRSRVWRASPTTTAGPGPPGGPELFSSIDPVRWERCGENPVRLLGEVDAATLERAASDAALLERHRGRRGGRAGGPRAPRGRGPGHARAPDRVLLRRVRRAPLAARLLGRPRRARGRHPQGGVRPRAAARRDRPDVPPGLLPPAHRRRRLAARVLGRHRPRAAARRARHRRRRRAAHGHRARARHAGHGADLARRRRPRAALPARHRAARERPRGALDHLAPVHRRARRAARAVHPARRRRRPARSSALGIEPGLLHLNEGHAAFMALEQARAQGGAARRRPRGRARQDDLHHPHPGARPATTRTPPSR